MAGERLRVNEIFYSIQGESTHVGRPCVFVRLTGCNLRCNYCDTEYAFYEGRQMAITEVAAEVARFDCELVEITGGEPMLQPGIHPLIETQLRAGRTVMIETSGACDLGALDARVIKVMDIKCPGSGESEHMMWSNLQHLTAHDEVKFVVSNREDYEWARGVIARNKLAERARAVLLSPAFGRVDPAELAKWILEDRLPARLQLQLHKHVWPPETRGV